MYPVFSKLWLSPIVYRSSFARHNCDGHGYDWLVLFPFNGVTTYSQTSLYISVYASVYDQRKLILVREDSFSVKNLKFKS